MSSKNIGRKKTINAYNIMESPTHVAYISLTTQLFNQYTLFFKVNFLNLEHKHLTCHLFISFWCWAINNSLYCTYNILCCRANGGQLTKQSQCLGTAGRILGVTGSPTHSATKKEVVNRNYHEVTGDIICPSMVMGIDHLRDPRLNKVHFFFESVKWRENRKWY